MKSAQPRLWFQCVVAPRTDSDYELESLTKGSAAFPVAWTMKVTGNQVVMLCGQRVLPKLEYFATIFEHLPSWADLGTHKKNA